MRFNGVLFPIATPRVTLPFKATETKWYSEEKPHRGVDLAPYPGSTGEPVRNPLHGQVVRREEHPYAGLTLVTQHEAPFEFWAHDLGGQVVTVARGETIFLRSCHHQELLADAPDEVAAGELIARVGNTGAYTSGPHVHLELHHGSEYPGHVLNALDFFIAAIPGLRDHLQTPW